jgi:hypothetical protein
VDQEETMPDRPQPISIEVRVFLDPLRRACEALPQRIERSVSPANSRQTAMARWTHRIYTAGTTGFFID